MWIWTHHVHPSILLILGSRSWKRGSAEGKKRRKGNHSRVFGHNTCHILCVRVCVSTSWLARRVTNNFTILLCHPCLDVSGYLVRKEQERRERREQRRQQQREAAAKEVIYIRNSPSKTNIHCWLCNDTITIAAATLLTILQHGLDEDI